MKGVQGEQICSRHVSFPVYLWHNDFMIWNSEERAKDCWSSYTQPVCQHSWNLTLRWTLQQTWWLLSTHRLSPVSLLAEHSCCLGVPSPGGFRRIRLHRTATGPTVRVWAHHGGPVLLADGSSGWARVTIVAKETWERVCRGGLWRGVGRGAGS